MAEDVSENAENNSQVPEEDIAKTLKQYDIKNDDSVCNGDDWSFTKDNLMNSEAPVRNVINIDKYWNFYGYMNPKIEVEFYVTVLKEKLENGEIVKEEKKEWININNPKEDLNLVYKYNKDGEEIKKIVANNNSYIVSANVIDNGSKELELVLYDRNFTDVQNLIVSSISNLNDINNYNKVKNKELGSSSETEVEGGNNIEYLVSPLKTYANLRIRYGYNEDRNTEVSKAGGYSGINWSQKALANKNSDSRWRSVEEKAVNERNESIKTDTMLMTHFQQSTLFSEWENYIIVGLGSTLSNSGIKYTIKGISSESFALNGYKIYQQYSVIKGTPKKVLSTLMNLFNKEESTAPIKLVWADPYVKAEESTINGQDIVIDYKTGSYELVDENKVKEIKETVTRPLEDIPKYINMLTDIKACFQNVQNNHLKDYVDGKDVEYNKHINGITDRYRLSSFSEYANKRSYMDFVMWPFYADTNYIDEMKLEGSSDYGNNLSKMAIFQNEVSTNFDFLRSITDNKNSGGDRRSIIYNHDIAKIWLANIAISAYDLKDNYEATPLTEIREKIEKDTFNNNSFFKAHSNLKSLIEETNDISDIKWKIKYPYGTENIAIFKENEEKNIKGFENDDFYIPTTILIGKYEVEVNDFLNSDPYSEISEYSIKKINNIIEATKSNDFSNKLKKNKERVHNNYIRYTMIAQHNAESVKNFFLKDGGATINIKNIMRFINDQLSEDDISNLAFCIKNIYDDRDTEFGQGTKFQNLLNMMKNEKDNSIDYLNSSLSYKAITYLDANGNKKNIFRYNESTNEYELNGFEYDGFNFGEVGIHRKERRMNIYGDGGKLIGQFSFNVNIKDEIYNKIGIENSIKSSIQFILNLLNKNKDFLFLEDPKKEKSEFKACKVLKDGETWESITNSNKYSPEESAKEYLDDILVPIKTEINSLYNSTAIIEGVQKNIKQLFNDCKGTTVENEQTIAEQKKKKLKGIMEDLLNNINKQQSDLKLKKFCIGSDGGDAIEEEFGNYNNGNLLERAFKLINENFKNITSNSKETTEKSVKSLIDNIDEKIKNLSKELEHYNSMNQKIDNSNLGKEIELSLGTQDSRVKEKKLTKSLSSLLNDFCNQCQPKISARELEIKQADDTESNRIEVKDDNGDDKVIEVYQNFPRYNLTWGVVGTYKKETPEEKPIIGLYYKEPRKISKLRKYDWGIGNNQQHCIKGVSISTSSEFAILNTYNTLMTSENGQVINLVNNNEGTESQIENILPPKTPCFFNQVFDANREKNIFNNMINSLSSGTITLLGDPSLKFSGVVQPYTYPIYLNIVLSRNGDGDWNAGTENNTTEFSQLSGYYVITKITHNISTSGYTTTLDVMKYPGSGDAFLKP